MQRTRLFLLPSLVASGYNHRWCERYGVLEHALPEFLVLERHKGLTESRLTNT